MNNQVYYLVIDGKPQGPFTLQQLLLQKITPNSYLKNKGMADYKQAHEIEEIRSLLNIKPQFTAPQYFAGFDLRLLAATTDWFIVLATLLLIDLLIVLAYNQTPVITILIYSLLLAPFLKFVYQVILEIKCQATIGKKLINIKVTNLEGQKANALTIIARNLYKIISTASLFMGYLYSFANKKQQCLHDVIAHTLVIKERLI